MKYEKKPVFSKKSLGKNPLVVHWSLKKSIQMRENLLLQKIVLRIAVVHQRIMIQKLRKTARSKDKATGLL
jgi:hypothetical protein